MGILTRVFGRKQEARTYPPHWLARLFGEWYQSTSGVQVDSGTALTFTAFYAAVDAISRTIASLPCLLYRRMPNDARDRALTHPLYTILHTRPNPEQTAFVWRHTMLSNVLRWGNAYSEIERNQGGRPIALWPMSSADTTVERLDDRLIYIINKQQPGERRIPAENVWHLRTLGDGLVGKSPVTLFRESIGLGLAAERAGSALFGNGMRASGILTHPNVLSDKALEHLRETMKGDHGGSAQWGKMMIFEEGMKYEQLSIPPDDAQFLETRVHQVRDIARIYHVPPHKLADLADATFSNVEEQNTEWVTDCLAPWLVNFEQESDAKLLMPSEIGRYYVSFLVEGLLRGNAAARSAYYSTMFNIGALSINDIRRLENMNPIGEEGDEHYIPVNLQSAKKAIEDPEPAPLPELPAEPPEEPQKDMKAHRYLLVDTCDRVLRMVSAEIAKRNGDMAQPPSLDDDCAWWKRAVTILGGPVAACFEASGVRLNHRIVRSFIDQSLRSYVKSAPLPLPDSAGVQLADELTITGDA